MHFEGEKRARRHFHPPSFSNQQDAGSVPLDEQGSKEQLQDHEQLPPQKLRAIHHIIPLRIGLLPQCNAAHPVILILSSSLLHPTPSTHTYNLNINIFSMKDNTKMNLDAINILKGLAYSQLEVETC